jgi:hypothetical protein
MPAEMLSKEKKGKQRLNQKRNIHMDGKLVHIKVLVNVQSKKK